MVGGAVIEINQLAAPADLEPVWTALEAKSDASFFLSWNWIGTWLEISALRPRLVTVRRDGTIVALGLLQESRRRRLGLSVRVAALHETGDAAMDSIYIEYNGLLCARVERDSILEEVLRAAAAQGWDEIRLSAVTTEAGPLAAAAGWHVTTRNTSRCFAVDLAARRAQGGSYVDGLGANTRQQIRRTERLYAARGAVTLTAADSLAQAKLFLAELKALHQSAWHKRGRQGAFANPFFERFHDRLIERLWPQGGVELLKISAGPHVVGYLYNFIHRGIVMNYQSGFAAVDDNKLKPGLLSHALCVERHLALGAARYDLMAGEARYKQNLAAPHTTLAWLTLRRPGLLTAAENLARRFKQALALSE